MDDQTPAPDASFSAIGAGTGIEGTLGTDANTAPFTQADTGFEGSLVTPVVPEPVFDPATSPLSDEPGTGQSPEPVADPAQTEAIGPETVPFSAPSFAAPASDDTRTCVICGREFEGTSPLRCDSRPDCCAFCCPHLACNLRAASLTD